VQTGFSAVEYTGGLNDDINSCFHGRAAGLSAKRLIRWSPISKPFRHSLPQQESVDTPSRIAAGRLPSGQSHIVNGNDL